MNNHKGLKMRNINLIIALILLTACAPLSPVIVTDVKDEYIIVGRDTTPFVSLQKDAEINAINGAIKFCNTLGKDYFKKFIIPTPMMPGKFSDATLHFRCIDKAPVLKNYSSTSSLVLPSNRRLSGI